MENSVSNYFDLQSSIVLMFPIAAFLVLFVKDFVNQNICCPITNSCLALSKGGKYLAWLKNLMLGVRQARHLSEFSKRQHNLKYFFRRQLQVKGGAL